jgi:microcystin-dependent protein
MSTPYIGEIRIFAGNFAILDWAFCNGSLQSISANSALFNLIGTTYGGDGQTTFGLPDLQGRFPIHQGTGAGLPTYVIGQKAGVETVTLNTNQIPSHSHVPASSGSGGSDNPTGNYWGASTGGKLYSTNTPNLTMNNAAIGITGGSQPHDNMQPFLCIIYIISLFGIFPSQN